MKNTNLQRATEFAVGLLFGWGLMIAGMTDPSLLGYEGATAHGATSQEHTMTESDATSGHQGGTHK